MCPHGSPQSSRFSPRSSLSRSCEGRRPSKRLTQAILATALIAACLTGCAKQSVIVPRPGAPMQLMRDVTATVSVQASDGIWVVRKAKIPAGYWVVPDPDFLIDLPNPGFER